MLKADFSDSDPKNSRPWHVYLTRVRYACVCICGALFILTMLTAVCLPIYVFVF